MTPSEDRRKQERRKRIGRCVHYRDLLPGQELDDPCGRDERKSDRRRPSGAAPASEKRCDCPGTPIDGKFEVRDGRIVNKVSGEPIPDDEPRFLLRARDHHAYQTLMHYLALCEEDCNSLHLEGTKQTIRKFIDFTNAHPERMKQPGVTKHLKLDAAASPVERAAGETTHCCEHSEAYTNLAKRANQLEHIIGQIALLLREDMTQ